MNNFRVNQSTYKKHFYNNSLKSHMPQLISRKKIISSLLKKKMSFSLTISMKSHLKYFVILYYTILKLLGLTVHNQIKGTQYDIFLQKLVNVLAKESF